MTRSSTPIRITSSRCLLLLVLAFSCLLQTFSANGQTLELVRSRESIRCIGVLDAEREMLDPGSVGGLARFETMMCRALAAAVLGDGNLIEILQVGLSDRVQAIENGDADISFGLMTITARRDQRVNFPIIMFFDTLSAMAPVSMGIKSLGDAKDATLCVVKGSTDEQGLSDYVTRQGLQLNILQVASSESQMESYSAGRCKIISGARYSLNSRRVRIGLPVDQHIFLKDAIAEEPISPMVRRNDVQWTYIVRWVLNALILAEELGIRRDTIDATLAGSPGPEAQRLLGLVPHPLETMGLSRDSLVKALRVGGNYGEIYETAFGVGTAHAQPRGRNALARDGGLLFPLPYR